MSAETLVLILDEMKSGRESGVPLRQRIGTYIQAAVESAKTPGVRLQSLEFAKLAVKSASTVVFEAGVTKLTSFEPQIINAIEKTGDAVVGVINKAGQVIKKVKKR